MEEVEIYEYKASVIRVVDGDTLWLDVELGFDVRRKDSFRLYGINAPEMNTPEGHAAKDWLIARIQQAIAGGIFRIQTDKDKREKFGRYLVTLYDDLQNINQEMIAEGHAVAYP